MSGGVALLAAVSATGPVAPLCRPTGTDCTVVCALGSARAARYLLRHLSQPANEDRRPDVRHDGPGETPRACRRVGEDGSQAPRRHDAAARCAPARPGERGFDGVVARTVAGRGGRRASESGPRRAASAQSREYAAAIDDLLGIKIDAAALLPKDDEAEGFDNVASVLTVSPSFLDQYISAARVVSARAVGNPAARPGSQTYRPSRGTDQSCASMVFRSARAEDCWSSTCSRRRRLQAQYPEHGDRRLRPRHGA